MLLDKLWTNLAFLYTINEGPVRIQYKCLVPIYVFSEMKLGGVVISKTEFCPPNLHIHVSMSHLYIPRTGLPILQQPSRQTNPGNMYIAHRYMNVGTGNKAGAVSFLGIHRIFGTVYDKQVNTLTELVLC
jgi:hypothetical protein